MNKWIDWAKVAGGFLLALLVLGSCGIILASDAKAQREWIEFDNGCKADGLRISQTYDEWGNVNNEYCFDRNNNHLVREYHR